MVERMSVFFVIMRRTIILRRVKAKNLVGVGVMNIDWIKIYGDSAN